MTMESTAPIPRSIFFSALQRYGNLLLFLLSTAVLSRLLTPGEFGVYAVVNAVTAVVVASFQEFGGANYIIQKRTLTHEDIRTAFTITLGVSLLAGATLLCLSSSLAKLFGREELEFAVVVSSLNFVATPISATICALLQREMKFGALAAVNLIASVVVATASIALAVMKYSYMAPIWGTVAGNVVLSSILVCRPGSLSVLRLSFSGYREVVRFGLYSSGVSVINVFYNLCPQLFLARNLDFASVGLYSRAVGATQMFDRLVMQAVGPVIMPGILSHQKAGANVKRLYLDAIELISVLQWPFLFFVASMARPIIESWLGDSWIAVTPLIRILCLANLALFAASLTYPILVAVGKVRDALISSLISLPPSLLAIYVTSFWGVHAVTMSALLTLPFQAIVANYFVVRELNIRWTDIGRALMKSAIVAAIVALVSTAFNCMLEVIVMSPVTSVALGCCVAGVSWLLGLTATKHPLLSHLRNVFEKMNSLVAASLNLWPRKMWPLKVRG